MALPEASPVGPRSPRSSGSRHGVSCIRAGPGAGSHVRQRLLVLADIERAHPEIRSLVDRLDVAFWGHGMIRPRPGEIFGPARAERAKPIERVHFAHTDLSGMALFEEAFDQGLRAAREVAEALA